MSYDPRVLPTDLPIPQDDGAADHLRGLQLPSLRLEIGAKPISRKVGCISWRASR